MTNLDTYAQLKIKIAQLEAEAEILKPLIIKEMEEDGADEWTHQLGSFILSRRRTWTYPADISSREKQLKDDKKRCEQIGSASYVENPVLMFKASKE